MIPVENMQLPSVGNIVMVDEALTDEDEEQILYADALIEEAAVKIVGNAFRVSLLLPPKVIWVLKQRWEIGGWTVCVFQDGDAVQMVFIRSSISGGAHAGTISRALVARDIDLNQIIIADRRRLRLQTPLLVRMPTRGRPEQAIDVLAKYREMAESHVVIEVVIDYDDILMHMAEVQAKLAELDCVVTVGNHRSKIAAVNGGRVDDWQILVLASDDMVPVERGYDQRIIRAMQEHFPLYDGALCYNDGYNKDHRRDGKPVLCTLPVMGRHLYEQFGYVYWHEYGSLYCDDEYTELLTSMQRLVYVDEMLIEHRHHAAGKAAYDVLYKYNDEKWGANDRDIFRRRAALRREGAQHAFDSPPVLLSILICSMPARRQMLDRLVDYLRWQCGTSADAGGTASRQVEILVEIDSGEKTIGEKRQRLLERAQGDFVAFVDDDDGVDARYIERVLSAIVSNPSADCVSLVGMITTDGENARRFEHTLKYDRWFTREDGLFCRTPNHLNAVRRELALKAGFVAKSFGEDHLFSEALYPLLKREADSGDEPLYYYFERTRK